MSSFEGFCLYKKGSAFFFFLCSFVNGTEGLVHARPTIPPLSLILSLALFVKVLYTMRD